MEAIAAMIGSSTTAAASSEEREIQIVEIFNQDVAKSGLGPFLRSVLSFGGESITSLSLQSRCHF